MSKNLGKHRGSSSRVTTGHPRRLHIWILFLVWPLSPWHLLYFTLLRFPTCTLPTGGNLGVKCSTQALVLDYLATSWWYCFERLWNLKKMEPCWRKCASGGRVLRLSQLGSTAFCCLVSKAMPTANPRLLVTRHSLPWLTLFPLAELKQTVHPLAFLLPSIWAQKGGK